MDTLHWLSLLRSSSWGQELLSNTTLHFIVSSLLLFYIIAKFAILGLKKLLVMQALVWVLHFFHGWYWTFKFLLIQHGMKIVLIRQKKIDLELDTFHYSTWLGLRACLINGQWWCHCLAVNISLQGSWLWWTGIMNYLVKH